MRRFVSYFKGNSIVFLWLFSLFSFILSISLVFKSKLLNGHQRLWWIQSKFISLMLDIFLIPRSLSLLILFAGQWVCISKATRKWQFRLISIWHWAKQKKYLRFNCALYFGRNNSRRNVYHRLHWTGPKHKAANSTFSLWDLIFKDNSQCINGKLFMKWRKEMEEL